MLAKRNRVPTARIEPDRKFVVRGDHITLGQLLKLAGVIGSGGEAKIYLSETAVMVNGEPEQRRGRKLRPGDRVQAPDTVPIRLIAPGEEGEREEAIES